MSARIVGFPTQIEDLAERQNALRLFREYMAAVDALVVAIHGGADADEVDELAEAANEAERIYNDCGYELDCDYADEPLICAATGAPILVSEPRVFDPETNDVFLRACAN